jgi:hypothetical protein
MLDEAQGIRVTLRHDNRPVRDYVVGATREGRTFLRRPGGSQIFSVEDLRRDDVERPLDDLREHRIFDVKSDEITALTVLRGRQERMFVKQDGKWAAEPADENWIADPTKVSGAASSLATLRANKFADDATPGVTGLGGPFASAVVHFDVTPEGKSATTYSIAVGNMDEEKENYYVVRTDEAATAPAVYLVSKYTIERLIGNEENGLDEYREKRVLRDVQSDKVKAVTVTLGGVSVTFEKGAGADEWKPAAGSPLPAANGRKISELVRKATSLRADSFLDIGLSGQSEDGAPVRLQLQQVVDEFPRRVREAMEAGSLGGTTDQLQIANLLTHNAQQLAQLAPLYAIVYPESAPVTARAIREAVRELQGTYVSLRDPLNDLALELTTPVEGVPVAWTFKTEDDRTYTIRIGGRAPDGKRPVTTDAAGDRQIYMIDATKTGASGGSAASDKFGDLLLEDLNVLRDEKLLADVAADRITRASFTNAGTAWDFTHAIDGDWAAVTAIPGFDKDKLASLVRRILDLKPAKFVRTTPEAAGLAAPVATVTLTWTPAAPAAAEGQPPPPAPAPRTVVIAVGSADAEGQRHVRLSGEGVDALLASAIFLVAKGTAEDLLFDASKASSTEAAPAPSETPQVDEQFLQMYGTQPTPPPAPAPAPANP